MLGNQKNTDQFCDACQLPNKINVLFILTRNFLETKTNGMRE